MKHAFLVEPGIWVAEGTYGDENGKIVKATGETKIYHQENFWLNEGRMVLHIDANNTAEIRNKYQIKPLPEKSDHTTWVSENPGLGKLEGKFIFVGDTIMSIFNSVDGEYTGCETLVTDDGKVYKNRGCLFKGNVKISSWSLTLERKSF